MPVQKLKKILSRFFRGKNASYDTTLLLYRYNDLQPYIEFYKPESIVYVVEELQQNESFSFGETLASVVSQYGKKFISVNFGSQNEIEVIQYKMIVEDEKVKKQFHFYRQKLFAYSEIYSYLKPDNEDKLIRLSLQNNTELNSLLKPNTTFDFNGNLRLIYKKDVELAFHLVDTSQNLLPVLTQLTNELEA